MNVLTLMHMSKGEPTEHTTSDLIISYSGVEGFIKFYTCFFPKPCYQHNAIINKA